MSDTDNTFAPVGEPDRRKRDDWLLLLLLLSLGDYDAAEQTWREHVSPNYAGMLDASDGFTWDELRQAYFTRHGRKLDGGAVKRIATTFHGSLDHDLRRLASDMAVGLLDVGDWQRRTAAIVKSGHLATSALAAGGFSELDGKLKSAVIGTADKPPGLAFSLGKLWEFGHDIGTDRNNSEASVVNRASLYSSALGGTFEHVRRESHRAVMDDHGMPRFLYERNLLGPTEQHCTSFKGDVGCVECTEAGWQPIGTLPLPGLRACRMGCGCSLDYSLTGGQSEQN